MISSAPQREATEPHPQISSEPPRGDRLMDCARTCDGVGVACRLDRAFVADIQGRKPLTNPLVIAVAVAMIVAVLGALVNVAASNDFMHRAYHP
jgi:hypothetical protein